MNQKESIISPNELTITNTENELIELTDDLLRDAKASIHNNKTLSVPIAELSTLGAGISSLIPAFNTVTQTTSIATDGLYRVANSAAGDFLKQAKDGTYWGAMKTATGRSKMAKFAEVGPLNATTQTVAAFNPGTMLMAAALYSIEKNLDEIKKTQKKIMSFLEIENESQIEADLESLMSIVSNYKYNWDNKLSIASSHKLVIDIKNRARKNMNVYQKKVTDSLSSKQYVVAQGKINAFLSELEKKFKYYRLSLYIFSLASLIEIMLSENYREDYICRIKKEVKTMSDTYRMQFTKASLYLEKMANIGIETNIVKGIGTAGNTLGKFIGNIPLIKEGPVDEFLQDKGSHLQRNAMKIEQKAIRSFATLGNPETSVFEDRMDDMIQIFNHTSQICFDQEKIYLMTD